jgi:hypothetical protein
MVQVYQGLKPRADINSKIDCLTEEMLPFWQILLLKFDLQLMQLICFVCSSVE